MSKKVIAMLAVIGIGFYAYKSMSAESSTTTLPVTDDEDGKGGEELLIEELEIGNEDPWDSYGDDPRDDPDYVDWDDRNIY